MKTLGAILLILVASLAIAFEQLCFHCKQRMPKGGKNCPNCGEVYLLKCPDCENSIQSMDGVLCPYCMTSFPPKSDAKKREIEEKISEVTNFIQSSDRIDFYFHRKQPGSVDPERTVVGRINVTNFLAGVMLQTKGPSQCAHSRTMAFVCGSNMVAVSYCEGCFDVYDSGKVLKKLGVYMSFCMPKDLLTRIQQIEKGTSEPEPAR